MWVRNVLAERINPGRVLDYETDLEDLTAALVEFEAVAALLESANSD